MTQIKVAPKRLKLIIQVPRSQTFKGLNAENLEPNWHFFGCRGAIAGPNSHRLGEKMQKNHHFATNLWWTSTQCVEVLRSSFYKI